MSGMATLRRVCSKETEEQPGGVRSGYCSDECWEAWWEQHKNDAIIAPCVPLQVTRLCMDTNEQGARMETTAAWAKLRDGEILEALLECEDLADSDRKAFEDMQQQLLLQKYRTLSYRQRGWLNTTYEQLRPDLQRAKRVKSGKVSAPKSVPVFDWEKNRPLKPPGR